MGSVGWVSGVVGGFWIWIWLGRGGEGSWLRWAGWKVGEGRGGVEGRKKGRERTFGVELQDVDVAVCVCGGDVELFVRREEGGRHDFDGVGGLAEDAQLVGFLLCSICISHLFSVCNVVIAKKGGWLLIRKESLVPYTRRTKPPSPHPPSDTTPSRATRSPH